MNLETEEVIKERIPPLGSNTKWGPKKSENTNNCFHNSHSYFVSLPIDFIEHKFGHCARFNIRKTPTSWSDQLRYWTMSKCVLMRTAVENSYTFVDFGFLRLSNINNEKCHLLRSDQKELGAWIKQLKEKWVVMVGYRSKVKGQLVETILQCLLW